SDQKKAADTKADVDQQTETKITQSKLDKILEELDKVKKKASGGGLLATLMAGVAALLTKLKGLQTAVLGYIKTIGTWLLKKIVASFAWLRKLGEAAGWIKRVGAATLEGVGAVEMTAAAGAGAMTALEAVAVDKMAKYEYNRAMQ